LLSFEYRAVNVKNAIHDCSRKTLPIQAKPGPSTKLWLTTNTNVKTTRHISQPTTLNVSLTDVMQKPLAVTTDASQYEYMIMEAKQQCYK